MKYLLDTSAISEIIRPKPDARALQWIRDRDEDSLFVSVITIGELQKGAARLEDGKRKQALRAWIDEEVTRRFIGRILPVDLDIAEEWGRLQARARAAGRPLPAIDGLLVATALVHRFAMVTRDTRDMSGRGVDLENPWSA